MQSELAETKLSLESERDALQARLVELSSAQDEELDYGSCRTAFRARV